MEERTIGEVLRERGRSNEFEVLLEKEKAIREQQVLEEERIRLLREEEMYYKKEKAYFEGLAE